MNLEYDGCYTQDEIVSDLSRNGILLPDMSQEQALALINAWKLGYDAGATHVQEEWDRAEELAYESKQGWDF